MIRRRTEVHPAKGAAKEAQQADLGILRASIELSERFSLLLAVCNQIPLRNRLMEQLRESLPSHRIEHVELAEPVPSLLSLLRERLEGVSCGALFVSGIEKSMPNSETAQRSEFIAYLNLTRDSFSKVVACPMVLWIPQYVLQAIQRGAPDFYSVHSGVFHFEEGQEKVAAMTRAVMDMGGAELLASNVPERQLHIASVEKLLGEYEARPADRRDIQTEIQLRLRLVRGYHESAQYAQAKLKADETVKLIRQSRSEDLATLGQVLSWLGRILDDQGDLGGR